MIRDEQSLVQSRILMIGFQLTSTVIRRVAGGRALASPQCSGSGGSLKLVRQPPWIAVDFSVTKDRDAGGVTVNVVFPADGAEFSLSEEPGQRHRVQSLLNRASVVVCSGEQPSASSVATE